MLIRSGPTSLMLVVLFTVALLIDHDLLSSDTTTTATAIAIAAENRPNILILLTDDQDVLLGSADHMPQLHHYLLRQPEYECGGGMEFINAFVHTPICCPSRSSIWTGRYLHHIGTAQNNSITGNCNGMEWQQYAEPYSVAVTAQTAGYRTAYAGKYLNGYGIVGSPNCSVNQTDGCRRVPPGWDRWMGLVGNSVYYNYSVVVSDDGGATSHVQHYGIQYDTDYLPDVIARRTMQVLKEFTSEAEQSLSPWLVVMAWPTPHDPFTPAPQYQDHFAGVQAPRTPNFNTSLARNAQKHWFMRQLGPIDSATEEYIDAVYVHRLQALLSVDDHIGQVAQFLQQQQQQSTTNQWDNALVIFLSDNGWQMGQHLLRRDKRHLYEHDIRVPFFVKPPKDWGISSRSSSTKTTSNQSIQEGWRKIYQPVLNIDIAPTIYELLTGNSTIPPYMDGMSILPLLGGERSYRSKNATMRDTSSRSNTSNSSRFIVDGSSWHRDFLITYHGEGNPPCGMLWTCPPPPQVDFHEGDAWNNTYHCVRTMSFDVENDNDDDDDQDKHQAKSDSPILAVNDIYCQFADDEDFVEYYDLLQDPWQLDNGAADLTQEKRTALQRRLEELKQCHGDSCRHLKYQHWQPENEQFDRVIQ